MAQSDNQKRYANALEAIKTLFKDASVSKDECIGNLQDLQYEIDILLDSLKGNS
jgi:sensor histidine kinase YesM